MKTIRPIVIMVGLLIALGAAMAMAGVGALAYGGWLTTEATHSSYEDMYNHIIKLWLFGAGLLGGSSLPFLCAHLVWRRSRR